MAERAKGILEKRAEGNQKKKPDGVGGRMTREEKEQIGKYLLQMARYLEDGCYQQEILLKAAHIVDEALEQESTLDKIRSETEGVIQEDFWW